jgi:uncharacterized membrane protein
MVPELTASGSALAWGAADFCGGKASRRVDARAVVVVAHASSLPLLALSLAMTGGGPAAADLGWGFLAGLCGGVALVLLYGALATGVMSVVAPVTAVTAALLPLAVGLVVDPTPGPVELAGVCVAVVAIGLVSAAPGEGAAVSSRVLALSVAAGAGLGLFYVLLEPVRAGAGLWPLVGIRAATLLVGLAMLAQARIPPRLDRRSLVWAVGAGALDWAANALYLVATYTGVLSVVAPIASLYPAGTVLLAVAVDRERPRPVRIVGLALAAVALVLARTG